ncbi:CST complex subunit [Dirofilaria immitis]
MTGSSTSTLFMPIMNENAIRDGTTDRTYLATSSNQHLHFNETSLAETNDHLRSELSNNRKNRRDRINILHLLRRQLNKIASHNFYATQRRNKQTEIRQMEIRHNICDNDDDDNDDNEMKQISDDNNGSDDANLHDHNENNNYDGSKKVHYDHENDESYRYQRTPAVYQDPYCAVTVDRKVHVYGYYVQNDQLIDSNYYNAQSTRIIYANDISAVFHTDNEGQLTSNICRSWGLSRNSVWWAADPQRSDSGKEICLVVLQLKDHPILIGFTIINLIAFINALKICGLNEDCKFISSLPTIMESCVSEIRPHDDSQEKTKTSNNEISFEDNMDGNSK